VRVLRSQMSTLKDMRERSLWLTAFIRSPPKLWAMNMMGRLLCG
jgi:hypothetical protein